MKPSEVIRETKVQLFERGWAQGKFENDRGEVCVRGAIGLALFGDTSASIRQLACDPIEQLILEAVGCEVTGWNDDKSRTFDEVIDGLDKAEKLAEQRELNV